MFNEREMTYIFFVVVHTAKQCITNKENISYSCSFARKERKTQWFRSLGVKCSIHSNKKLFAYVNTLSCLSMRVISSSSAKGYTYFFACQIEILKSCVSSSLFIVGID